MKGHVLFTEEDVFTRVDGFNPHRLICWVVVSIQVHIVAPGLLVI